MRDPPTKNSATKMYIYWKNQAGQGKAKHLELKTKKKKMLNLIITVFRKLAKLVIEELSVKITFS